MDMHQPVTVEAEPYPFEFVPVQCALLIIDMQRDFLEPGGFGEILGNDVAQLRRTIEPNRKLLAAWRAAGLQVIHTREGHRPDLSDLPPAKKLRGRGKTCIGDMGPMGRILVRGEAGHDIIPELYPAAGEPVIDNSTAIETNVPPIGPTVRVARSAPTRSAAPISATVISLRYAILAKRYSAVTVVMPMMSDRRRLRAGSFTSPATKLT